MLRFVTLLMSVNSETILGFAAARLARIWPAVALGAILLPWSLYPAVGGFGDALTLPKIWDGLWPVLLGGAAAFGLMRLNPRLPGIPQGDTVIIAEGLFYKAWALSRRRLTGSNPSFGNGPPPASRWSRSCLLSPHSPPIPAETCQAAL